MDPHERKVALSVKARCTRARTTASTCATSRAGAPRSVTCSARSSDARVGRSQYVPWRYLPL